jgi:tetratricopeptide (TPR) repeat protein
MGVVYAAHDPIFDREIAIKVMHHGQDSERFVVESRLTAKLPHPGIPPVYALGTLSDGRPFLAMKLIGGRTLAAELAAANRGSDLPRLLSAFEQICQTVGFAHSRGIIHRDLKPGNVMVGAFGEVLVMDWGLAREAQSVECNTVRESGNSAPERPSVLHATATEPATCVAAPLFDPTIAGQVTGTPAYMAPEQARGEPIDARADVFALGGILAAILTGYPPFVGETVHDTIIRAALGELKECFDQLDAAGIDAELVLIVKKFLAAEPAYRFANGEEAAAAVAAYRAGVEERLRKAERERAAAEAKALEEVNTRREAEARTNEQRKRRRVQQLLAVVAVLFVAASGVFAWYTDRQAFERQQKEQLAATEHRLKAEQARQGVAAYLTLAAELRREHKFRVADTALVQAAALAESGAPELLGAVKQARDELAFVVQLDGIRFRKWQYVAVPGGKGAFNTTIAPPEYRKAFAAHALDLAQIPPAEAAKVITSSAVKAELIAAVDDWALYEPDRVLQTRLLEIARTADPDPWTDRMRDSSVWSDSGVVARLAVIDPSTVSPEALSMLASIMESRALDPTPLLSAARAKHPTDFELAFALGRFTTNGRQIGPYEAARALRPDNPSLLNNLGVALQDRGDVPEAVAALQEAIRLEPRLALAHTNLGIALHSILDIDGALVECREAVRLNPTLATLHINLGRVLYTKGDMEEAIAAFREAIRLDPKLALAHANLGNLLRETGDFDEALAECKEAIHLDSRLALAHGNLGNAFYSKGEVENAVAAWKEAMHLDPKIASPHSNLGVSLQDRGDFSGAIAEYKEAIRVDPKYAEAHYNLGNALKLTGDLAGAIAAFQEAIRLNPRLAKAHSDLGSALQNAGDVEGAIAAHKTAIRMDSKYAPAHTNLGNALAAKGDFTGAIAEHKEAIRLDSKLAAPHTNLGNVLRAKGDFDGAIAEHKEAIRLAPRLVQAHYNLANTLQERGEVDAAIVVLREAIRVDPSYALAHNNLGLALYSKHDVDGAIVAWKEAIRLEPRFATAHSNLGAALNDKGDTAAAIAECKEAIRLEPKFVLAHSNLGNVLSAKGDLDGAIAAYKEAARLEPKHASAHYNLARIYMQQKKYTEAITSARDAIKADPKHPHAHAVLGVALHQTGDITGARAALTEAAKLDKRWAIELAKLPPVAIAPPPREVTR